jgi:hypothetical protein
MQNSILVFLNQTIRPAPGNFIVVINVDVTFNGLPQSITRLLNKP